jgi:hypothetical protein
MMHRWRMEAVDANTSAIIFHNLRIEASGEQVEE